MSVDKYPERLAGGFTRDDHQLLFYSRVRALLGPDAKVLEFGAGRGKFHEWYVRDGDTFKAELIDLRSTGAHVTGCDIDEVVLENPLLDDAHVIAPNGRLPFPDGSFDAVVSWAVLEHVEDQTHWAGELARVLKPGGWLCAWTPQRWGLVGVGGRIVPNRMHASVLKLLKQTDRGEEDIFPTRYRMNTRRRLRELFPEDRFFHATYPHNGPAGYLDHYPVLRGVGRMYASLPGGGTRSFLHVFIQRKDSA